MLFDKALCIMCKTRQKNSCLRVRSGLLGICRDCYDKLPLTGSTMCFPALQSTDYIIAPLYYKDSVRDAVLEYKFKDNSGYAKIFAKVFEETLINLPHLKDFDILVPVPLSKKRYNERGYNQAALIAKSVAKFLDIKYEEKLLIRNRDTKRQSMLKNHERLINVQGAFSVSENLDGKNIIIFDDIYTTGLTMEECAKTLKAAGANHIVGMTLSIVYKNPISSEARLIF